MLDEVTSRQTDAHRIQAWHLILVFAVSFVVRLTLYHAVDRPVSDATSEVDCRDYVQLGRILAEHGVFSRSDAEPFVRAVDRTPLYPGLIAACFKMAPDEETVIHMVLLAHHVMGAATASLCAWGLFLILPKIRWALTAGFLVGLEPTAIRCGMMTWTETFFIFLLIASIVLLLRYFESSRPSISLVVAAGVCLALTALCRPVGQEIALVVVPVALMVDPRQPWKARIWKAVVPFAAAYAITVAPWVIRNFTGMGVLNISTGAADARFLVAARVQAADDVFPRRPTTRDMSLAQRKLFIFYLTEFHQSNPWELADGASLEEEVDKKNGWAWPDVVPDHLTGRWMSFLAHKSSAILREHLGLYVKYSAEMCFQMVFGFNKDTLGRILKISPSPARISKILKNAVKGHFALAAHELATVTWLEWVGLIWSAFYAIVIPLMSLVGLYVMLQRKKYGIAALLFATCSLLILLPAFGVSMGYQSARYAVPVRPFLVLLAVVGCQMLLATIQRRPKPIAPINPPTGSATGL